MYLEILKNYINDNLIYEDYKEMINYHLNLYLSFFLKDDYYLKNIELKYDDYHNVYVYLYFDNCNVTSWFREKYCCSLNFMFKNDHITIESGLLPKFGVKYIEGNILYQFEINASEELLNIKELSVSKFDLQNGTLENFNVDISKFNEKHNIDIIYQMIEDIKTKSKNNLVRNREIIKL